MLELKEEIVRRNNEDVKESAVSVGISFVPFDEGVKEIRFVDFSNPEGVSRFLEWAIARSGLSKTEIARRLGINRSSFQAYYRNKKGKNIGIKWVIRFLNVIGGRLFVEVPFTPKPRRPKGR
jgi:hypothetical protein